MDEAIVERARYLHALLGGREREVEVARRHRHVGLAKQVPAERLGVSRQPRRVHGFTQQFGGLTDLTVGVQDGYQHGHEKRHQLTAAGRARNGESSPSVARGALVAVEVQVGRAESRHGIEPVHELLVVQGVNEHGRLRAAGLGLADRPNERGRHREHGEAGRGMRWSQALRHA